MCNCYSDVDNIATRNIDKINYNYFQRIFYNYQLDGNIADFKNKTSLAGWFATDHRAIV